MRNRVQFHELGSLGLSTDRHNLGNLRSAPVPFEVRTVPAALLVSGSVHDSDLDDSSDDDDDVGSRPRFARKSRISARNRGLALSLVIKNLDGASMIRVAP